MTDTERLCPVGGKCHSRDLGPDRDQERGLVRLLEDENRQTRIACHPSLEVALALFRRQVAC